MVCLGQPDSDHCGWHCCRTLDRDRLQAQGLQRLIFLSECRDRGVPIITVQGAPMLEGGEGQLVELALALGKERSVLRAQQGARDGLRDQSSLHGERAICRSIEIHAEAHGSHGTRRYFLFLTPADAICNTYRHAGDVCWFWLFGLQPAFRLVFVF